MANSFLTEGWEDVCCILCGHGLKTKMFWQDAEYGNILRCKQCGLAYRSPRCHEGYISQYFEEEWTESLTHKKARADILRKISKWILGRHPLAGSILDIGSGDGTLLAQFPETWIRFGVEPSKSGCCFARSRLPKANIVNATLGTANLPEKYFDVITLIGTVYYFSQPLKDLARIRGLLKPDGIALIESPNFSNRGYIYRWRNHRFSKAQVYFYTPKTIQKIIDEVGMEVIEKIDFPGHRISSNHFSEKTGSWIEFFSSKLIRKISFGMVDLVPRFVLVAKCSKLK